MATKRILTGAVCLRAIGLGLILPAFGGMAQASPIAYYQGLPDLPLQVEVSVLDSGFSRGLRKVTTESVTLDWDSTGEALDDVLMRAAVEISEPSGRVRPAVARSRSERTHHSFPDSVVQNGGYRNCPSETLASAPEVNRSAGGLTPTAGPTGGPFAQSHFRPPLITRPREPSPRVGPGPIPSDPDPRTRPPLSPVPAPAGALLLLCGLVGLAAAKRAKPRT